MEGSQSGRHGREVTKGTMLALALVFASSAVSDGFVANFNPLSESTRISRRGCFGRASSFHYATNDKERAGIIDECQQMIEKVGNVALSSLAGLALLTTSCVLPMSAHAEDELAAKYGNGKGFDSSLVDQTCLVDKCSLQAKACLADDPSCRKGLTCTAKCMGDNSCITGCMARYGDRNLDNLLKCTIEDNECIKVAILDGGADKLGEEPRPPAPTIPNFNYRAMEGTWYKVAGYNPNYDCYACQRNTFSGLSARDKLQVDVEFSMPRMLPDGTPPPPKNEKEIISYGEKGGLMYGSQSIGFNEYSTRETMVFDRPMNGEHSKFSNLVLNVGQENEISYSRTAHSEGEMFGLKFWENWYVIGENDPGAPEFKFIYYNGKTRQNTYEGAFVYSRSKELDPQAMKKVYDIASNAGMNPDQFCKIRNTCFADDMGPDLQNMRGPRGPFRGILASTKVSELLGVDSVAAAEEGNMLKRAEANSILMRRTTEVESTRPWWFEVGDYLENPNRHFNALDSLRVTMDWPEDVKGQR